MKTPNIEMDAAKIGITPNNGYSKETIEATVKGLPIKIKGLFLRLQASLSDNGANKMLRLEVIAGSIKFIEMKPAVRVVSKSRDELTLRYDGAHYNTILIIDNYHSNHRHRNR